ncbi:CDP-glycerol glycerophosphotransferase family protein [Thalassotalea fusca]
MVNFVQANQLPYLRVADADEARRLYEQKKPEWIIFGNAFASLNKINQHSRTALMQHGIGPKSCYYDVSESDIQYRFVEGQHRHTRLKESFPSKTFIDTGYAKLDPIINGSQAKPNITSLGLDSNKQTILYAPTYYPSSIEKLPLDFPEKLTAFNLIIKPHFFSLTKDRYRRQQEVFTKWQQYPNVYLAKAEEISILPFMAVADLLISDTSSTLFEFTALNKPAIWCDFFKVRWSYRGVLKWRLKKRLDQDLAYFGKVATRVTNINELLTQTLLHINDPSLKEPDRKSMTELLTGTVDGKCSDRIADFIIAESSNPS